MKKVLLVFAMLIALCTKMSAEKVIVDKEIGGHRVVQTERTPHIFLVGGTMNDGAISLDVWQKNNTRSYRICIYFYTVENIKKGAKLLLKFENDEVLELYCSTEATTTRTGVFPMMQTITVATYLISEEQLQNLMSHNVVKLRVETTTDFIDGKVYGKKFTKTITKDYKLIEQALQKQVSIYDDF